MRKFLSLLLISFIAISSIITVNAEEIPNIVDEINSGFEGVSAVQETDWYKLIDSFGSSKASDKLYKDIVIKSDGGHSGDNYISATLKQPWFSPSINIYPFIREAGADAYVISFWYKSNKNTKLSRFLIRGLAGDAYDSGEFMPDIVSRGSGNYYAELKGKSTDPDRNGWRFFASDPIEVVDEQFDGNHNWWLCFDQLSASTDAPLILDIDDFSICSELDFETPQTLVEKDIVTNITYLSDDVVSNAIKPDTENLDPVVPSPTAEPTPETLAGSDEKNSDTDFTLPIIVGASVFVVVAILTTIVLAKKKKK